MSLPEVPNMTATLSGTPHSTPEPEVSGTHATELSPTQRIERLRAENDDLRIQLDEAHVRLLHSQICHQADAQGRHAEEQIRRIMQQGINTLETTYFQLAARYKTTLSTNDGERVKLLEDIRITEELVASQKQLIDLYEARDRQQQQPASHLVDGDPLLSQYSTHSHCAQYPTYQQPHNQGFIIDTARLSPLADLDYRLGPSIEPCNPASTPVPEFEHQASIVPVQSNQTRSDGIKRELEDVGTKNSRKRKSK
ncbi:hypothetical protein BKA65DRAFT_545895 [Rhexocercosporidium sp. MPI-PUGE-AT-0058]|nr:hypothetical protein BKA65DRAFT_545895 [Rhexocercosporidium sp. MPI-PUGE-AT-0058]